MRGRAPKSGPGDTQLNKLRGAASLDVRHRDFNQMLTRRHLGIVDRNTLRTGVRRHALRDVDVEHLLHNDLQRPQIDRNILSRLEKNRHRPNTGVGEGLGADAITGLGRAFFYAGARSVLVTNWPVETVSARLLTTQSFRHQAEDMSINRAEALRRAELDLIDGPGYVGADGRPVFSYAHPLFWAPFTLVGDEG